MLKIKVFVRETQYLICANPKKKLNVLSQAGGSTKVMPQLRHVNYFTLFPCNASLGSLCWLAIQEWIVNVFESIALHYNQMTLIDYPQIDCILGINICLPFLENKPQAQVFLCCLLEQSYVHSWNRWVSCSCRHLDQPPCMCLHQGSMRKSNNKGVHFKGQQVREVK